MLFFLFRKKNILPYLCFQLPHRSILVTTYTLKIFSSPVQPGKKKTTSGLPMVKRISTRYAESQIAEFILPNPILPTFVKKFHNIKKKILMMCTYFIESSNFSRNFN